MYVTLKIQPKVAQLTFDDIINGIDINSLQSEVGNRSDTRTTVYAKTPEKLLEVVNIEQKIKILEAFNEKHKDLIETADKKTLYFSFTIPKRSGGLRPIDAPLPPLMSALVELRHIFERELFANYHTAAFAYIKGRDVKSCMQKHQANHSRWFLKTDLKNFFGSTTPEFMKKQLKMIFPYNEIYALPHGETALDTALSLCFLNGGLPQGTPISPLLTNLMMIPIDHEISRFCRKHTPHICYTRYADDIDLTSDISFKWTEVKQEILDILSKFEAPFRLNEEKTRYASSSGRNWNLGIMLNKDNDLTIGHRRKKRLKAKIFTFMNDFIKGDYWDIGDTQELQGEIAWCRHIEKENADKIVQTYSTKFNLDVTTCIKKIIKNEV